MLKHIFFDLDNTLTPSRTEMAPAHQPLFRRLSREKDVIVVSGAQASQVREQIPASIEAAFYILGQTGNQCIDKSGTELWKEQFSPEQTASTLAFIDMLKRKLALTVKDPNDLVEQRGAQISYSPIGHHEDLRKKAAFDPTQEMRRDILSGHGAEIASLKALGVDVVPGGTTCFDFFLAGRDKGFNVNRLIERERWEKEASVYVGDALFAGGNDETVMGVVPTRAVQNPDDTFSYIKTIV